MVYVNLSMSSYVVLEFVASYDIRSSRLYYEYEGSSTKEILFAENDGRKSSVKLYPE